MKFTQTLLAAAAALGLAAAGAQAAEKIKVGFIYVGPVGDFGWSYEHNQGRLAAPCARWPSPAMT